MNLSAVIVAAGSGSRMGGGIDKQYIMIGGMPVIAKTVAAFESFDAVDSICVAVKQGSEQYFRENIVEKYGFRKVISVVAGGKERSDSVKRCLAALPVDTDYVMIHDGARPFVSVEVIKAVLKEAVRSGAAVPAVPVKDTIKIIDGESTIVGTPERASLRAVQTPQCFKFDILMESYKNAAKMSVLPTDDASVVEASGYKVTISEGDYRNIKITTPEDIAMFGDYRTGTGFDVHAFAIGRKLIIGGVDIPYERGLEGHSDADVLVHSVMDALLGACTLGDIGIHFPDTDNNYKGISSMILLRHVGEKVREAGYRIVNVDSVIIAQKPKLSPYIQQMRQNMSEALRIRENAVSVKATTTERLGFTGREEGIAANASATVCG